MGAPALENAAKRGRRALLSDHCLGTPWVPVPIQNQSLRYAIHQLKTTIGIVAATPHQNGKTKSAIKLRLTTNSQNIRRCMEEF
jgi:hypothetical protein